MKKDEKFREYHLQNDLVCYLTIASKEIKTSTQSDAFSMWFSFKNIHK